MLRLFIERLLVGPVGLEVTSLPTKTQPLPPMANLEVVNYDSRQFSSQCNASIVNYDCKVFIRLTTGLLGKVMTKEYF